MVESIEPRYANGVSAYARILVMAPRLRPDVFALDALDTCLYSRTRGSVSALYLPATHLRESVCDEWY